MVHIPYVVERNVPAANRPGTDKPNTKIAMVIFMHPTLGRQMLAINEEQLRFEAGGDAKSERKVIEREINEVLSQMMVENVELIRG